METSRHLSLLTFVAALLCAGSAACETAYAAPAPKKAKKQPAAETVTPRLTVIVENAGDSLYVEPVNVRTEDRSQGSKLVKYADCIISSGGRWTVDVPDDGDLYRMTVVAFKNDTLFHDKLRERLQNAKFYIAPGEHLTLRGTLTDSVFYYEISGSPAYETFGKLRREGWVGYEIEQQQIYKQMSAARQANDATKYYALRPTYDRLDSLLKAAQVSAFEAHRTEPVAALLFLEIYSGDSISLSRYHAMSEAVRNGPYRQTLDAGMEFISERLESKDSYTRIQPGALAPDFTGIGLDSTLFNLHSLFGKGKYTLLDFGFLACAGCHAIVPELKAVYERRKEILEIVYVNIDGDDIWFEKQLWHYFRHPWISVSNHPSRDAVNVNIAYGLQAYPTLILIDPQGKIVWRGITNVGEMEATLDKLTRTGDTASK